MPEAKQDAATDVVVLGDALVDIAHTLLRRRWLVVGVTSVVAILAVVICLLLPDVFTGTARILPPDNPGADIGRYLPSLADGSSLGTVVGGLLGGRTDADRLVGILRSRSVADVVIEKFALQKYYNKDYKVEVYEELADDTTIEVGDGQIITISVEAKSASMAADMANTYVRLLDEISLRVSTGSGRDRREALEKQLADVRANLLKAETELKTFQEKNRLVALDAQARATIEAVARLQAEMVSTETEMAVLRQFVTERQNEYVALQSKMDALRGQLKAFDTGGSSAGDRYYLQLSQLPDLGMRLLGLMRDAKIQQELLALTTMQYELAKIEEGKQGKTIKVLDWAVPPDRKSSPRRALIVIAATFLAGVLSVLLAFLLEGWSRYRGAKPEKAGPVVGEFMAIFGRKRTAP